MRTADITSKAPEVKASTESVLQTLASPPSAYKKGVASYQMASMNCRLPWCF
jgi:hypothetical protein